MFGRRLGSGIFLRSTSLVIGATSPSPRNRKRNMYPIGLPSVHPKYACAKRPVLSLMVIKIAASAFGTAALLVRRMRWRPTRAPFTSISWLKSEASPGSISMKMRCSSGDRLWHPRVLSSLWS